MSKQIYLIYSCDEWKTKPMRLLMCTTSKRKLKSFIAKKIKDDTFGYCDEEMSKVWQVESFKADWDLMLPRCGINDRLHCGYFDYTYDGEEI